jgi:hypothetical protein
MAAPKGNKYGKQFKPGESGNPNGRPKGKTLTERVRDVLDENPDTAQAIVDAGIEAARKGDFQFWKYMFDRLDGTPTQQLNIDHKVVGIVRVQRGERQFKRSKD